ncbi:MULTISPECIES: SDR family NAD(P)-dependent oxidoreductase [Alphaproteobacteria]|uniref:Oxidoreductase n=2 Tax=Alphaproteobacteria TaxID=28211 RepID=A0A512HDQ0_9HYPH|nr:MULTISPECIES: glucose 1-dehydrogenase [Alphaproteobacteria]GEO83569.1 oxidoreductase [Ciceribacter naphthalenivorans]GLR24279.1 oxidoreductase [Ciceribacter naphthalenivorans]GLT07135.1 oxidoreductase [Sphingomonas psychrolutea]
MTKEFAGKVALVTGGGSGIGAACARQLADEGAKVVVADMHLEGAQQVVETIKAAGGEAASYQIDVSDPVAVAAMVDFTVTTFGGLDCAVNNAGIGGPLKPIAEYEIDEWRHVIDVNQNSVFYCMKYELQAMLPNGKGSIVNMSSILGTNGIAAAPAYVSAKHALVGMTKSAAIAYSAQGVRINAVAPGYIHTPLVENSLDEESLKALVGLHPIGRLGRADEVANLTLFLLSDRASFITGSYHLVDGAYAAQ